MLNLTLNHILKYLSVAVIVAIILNVAPGEKLEPTHVAGIAVSAAIFTFLLDLIGNYFGMELMSNVQPYDPYNIYNIAGRELETNEAMDPRRYQYIDRQMDEDAYKNETGLPGYYLVNNGEYNDGNVPYDTSSELINVSRKLNLDKESYNSAMAPCNVFTPEVGKDRPYPNVEPIQSLNM
ncbi:hypothetical protein Indivirus_1_131 [Indivirus ILV1]|uniref:Uncharacterized protein n=1 Tax=Indivirus ILV1 TaxID=1977633 RepID=A0A1V0SCX3_9VIRU|nr:hypothetical protein Indivirus_1_131 [Indivirus ILV1]